MIPGIVSHRIFVQMVKGRGSAGCPLAEGMDLMPREVIRYLQLGAIDIVLDAKTPWICAQCVVCTSR